MKLLLKSSASVHIYILTCLKRISWDYLLPLLKSIWTIQSRMVQRVVCTSEGYHYINLSHYMAYVYRNHAFSAWKAYIINPKLMNKRREGRMEGAREGWREPQTLVLLDNISQGRHDLMLEGWHMQWLHGERSTASLSKESRGSYFSMFVPCDIRTMLST